MKKSLRSSLLRSTAMAVFAIAAVGAFSSNAYAGTKKDSGAYSQSKTSIVEFAVASKDHTTLVAALKAAGLVETLSGKGPFTVFAPTNDAFAKLPAGTVENLLKPENKATLSGILTYHVVPSALLSKDVVKAVADAGGTLAVKTVNGGTVNVTVENGSVFLTDAKGGKAKVILADAVQSNGVIHVIDGVVLPQ